MRHAENILYRMCGLPILAKRLLGYVESDPDRGQIRYVYAASFWSPDTLDQWADVILSMALLPIAVLCASCWYTWKNGREISRRSGRSVVSQFADQIYFSAKAGILPPWYYIFELFQSQNRALAEHFLTRAETKQCIFPILSASDRASSPLGDKAEFASFCEQYGLETVPNILVGRRGKLQWIQFEELPPFDLFLKPVDGRGGRGAERWDHDGGRFRGPDGVMVDPEELLERIALLSNGADQVLQPRIRNHPALAGFSNGVLTTIRILSCIDERGEPEIVGAVFRMAIGSNQTVDNFHAGGILSAVDLESGCLGPATDLGTDARFGWVDAHPDTRQKITGEALPMWAEVKELVVRAHRAFNDRLIIGWDVAISPDGPILIEGNYGPDVDMMQRPTGVPLGRGRFAHVIAHHFRTRRAAVDSAEMRAR